MRSKKIFSAILVLALVIGLFPVNPLTTEAAESPVAPKKITIYGNAGTTTSFEVQEIPSGSEIDVSSVRSSKKSVATISEVYCDAYPKIDNVYSNGWGYIYLKIKKAGKTTVSYKIGSKTYKTRVTVKKAKSSTYKNPISSLSVSGVNGGKNLASKFKKTTLLRDMKLKATQNDAKVSVKAKSGWTIQSIYISSYDNTSYHYINRYSINDTSASLEGLTFKKGSNNRHYVNISFSKDNKYETIQVNFK